MSDDYSSKNDYREPPHGGSPSRPLRQSGPCGPRDIDAIRSLPGEEGEIARAIWGRTDDEFVMGSWVSVPPGAFKAPMKRRRRPISRGTRSK